MVQLFYKPEVLKEPKEGSVHCEVSLQFVLGTDRLHISTIVRFLHARLSTQIFEIILCYS